MNKKVKLIIEIAVFVVLLVVIACIYNFNDSNREELEAEAGNVGVVKITDENFNQEVIESDKPVILEIKSIAMPFSFIFLALSRFFCSIPSARPSTLPNVCPSSKASPYAYYIT